MLESDPDTTTLPACAWHQTLSSPALRGAAQEPGCAGVTRFQGGDGRIDQPRLRENVLCVHLGGPKRVTRAHGRHRQTHDVALGAITVMPAAEAYRWTTVGPIDFAHVTMGQDMLGRVALEEHGCDPRALRLRDAVGVADELARALAGALLAEAAARGGRLYCESLATALACHVVARYSNVGDLAKIGRNPEARPGTGGLAPWQLRRVIAFMHGHLAEDVKLAALVALTGLSRGHFFRAFSRSTGRSPHAYLTDLRVHEAQALLADPALSIDDVAASVGIGAASFPAIFRKRLGVTPRAFRRLRGVRAAEKQG